MLTFSLWALFLQGKAIDFVDVTESNARWVQDFRLKAYASPAKLESIDGGPGPLPAGQQFPLPLGGVLKNLED